MPTAVQDRPKTRSKSVDPSHVTERVHGNSKRKCQIKSGGTPCGKRAAFQTYAADMKIPVEDVIYTCGSMYHLRNAHKQITDKVKPFLT